MSDETILAVILAVIGSSVPTAFISASFARRKTSAEAEHERMQAAALLIQQIQQQLAQALERIRELEVEGRNMRETITSQAHRIDDLERLLRTNDVQFPPYMP